MSEKRPVPNGVRPVPEVRRGDIIVIEIPGDWFRVVCEAVGYPDDFAGSGVFHDWPKGTGWAIEVNCLGGSLKGASYWKQTEDGGILTNLSRPALGAEFQDSKTDERFRVIRRAFDDNDRGKVVEMVLENENGAELTVSENPPKHNPLLMEWHIGFVQFGLEYQLV